MKTLIHAAVCYLIWVVAAGAQVIYNNGGTYSQNFNSLSSNTAEGGILDANDPWTDNSTLTGWYANKTTYTTTPGILGLGLGVTSALTSSGAGAGADRALGSYLGLAGGPVTTGLRIQNNIGSTMNQFTLTFDVESSQSTLGSVLTANLLNAFTLSYSTTASDISGLGATGYQPINGNVNLLNASILSSAADTSRIQVTVGGLNVAQGADLWLRFDRTSLVGVVDNTLAVDNLSFTAVPEPSTYAMFGLGLAALVFLRRKKMLIGHTAVKSVSLAVIVTGLTLLPAVQAQEEVVTQAPLEETVVRSTAPETAVVAPAEKLTAGSAATNEYQPQWNRMMLKKDFEATYKTEIQKNEITIVDASHYFKAVRNYHVATGNTSTPPPVVWLRHESYLVRGGDQNTVKMEVPKVELPIARPDKLMPVLDNGKALFGDVPLSQDDYFNKMFYLRSELMDTTEKVNGLLKVWDTGAISPSDMSFLQSASKVEWLVPGQLIRESREIDNLLDSLYRQSTIRLTPPPMTPTGI